MLTLGKSQHCFYRYKHENKIIIFVVNYCSNNNFCELNMIVMKFGGSVLSSPTGFQNMASIIKTKTSEQLIIVVSAFSKVTNLLKQSSLLAESAKLNAAYDIINELLNYHIEFATGILLEEQNRNRLIKFYQESIGYLRDLTRGISITGELTARTLDIVMSYGEKFALQTVATYLKEQNIDFKAIDSADILVTDSNFGSAEPLISETHKKLNQILKPAFKQTNLVLTQGFAAGNQKGETTTMGIESSNLSATIFAELCNAGKLIIWTDVEGFRSADPRYVSHSLNIPHLDYANANFAAVNGLKLLYPTMINHLRKTKIPIEYRSATNPEGESTLIDNEFQRTNYKMIIIKENLQLIHIDNIFNPGSKLIENSPRNNYIHESEIFSVTSFPDSQIMAVDSLHPDLLQNEIPSAKILTNQAIITIKNVPQHEIIKIIPEISGLLGGGNSINMVSGNSITRLNVQQAQLKPVVGLLHDKLIKV